MRPDDFFLLGKIIRTHGVKGHVVVFLDADHPEHYKKIKNLFLKINSELKEFAVIEIFISGNTARVLLNDINDMTAAEEFLKHDVFLPVAELPPLKKNQFYFHELVGVSVHDKIKGNIGTIEKFYDVPGQAVAAINFEGKEILIPLHADFIEEFDKEKKTLFVNLPEGLVDIYL